MAVSGTGEGWSEAGGCLGRAEHRGWGPLGAAGRGRGPAPFVSWLIPVSVLLASPGAAPLGPVWPMEVQIWCEGGVAVMHTWGHTETFTKAHRDRQVCKYKHTPNPAPTTAQIHPNIQTHTPIIPAPPQGVTTRTPQAQSHTHTQRQMSPTRTLTPSQALHTHNPTLERCHTHAVSHTCKWHKYSVMYIRYRTVSCSVTHPVSQCHTPRVTHPVSPTHSPHPPGASPTLPAKPLIAPDRDRAPESSTEPNRAEPEPSRTGRAEPCRTGPC